MIEQLHERLALYQRASAEFVRVEATALEALLAAVAAAQRLQVFLDDRPGLKKALGSHWVDVETYIAALHKEKR